MGAVVITPLPSMLPEALQNSRVPSLHGHYPASSLLRTRPPPSRLRPTSRVRRLYGLPGSADFATGRGGFLSFPAFSGHRAVAPHPLEEFASPASLRRTLPPSPRIRGLRP